MTTIENEIIQELAKLGEDRQKQVLSYIRGLTTERLSARELMSLPAAKRAAYLQEAFRAAENEDFETFEAYSEESLSD